MQCPCISSTSRLSSLGREVAHGLVERAIEINALWLSLFLVFLDSRRF